jgi:mannose-1-phosphate guanylyltransferase
MEAIVLAGGKAERLGDAAGGLPKSLVTVGGQPLLAWQIGRLAQAGVRRVIVSCFGGDEQVFHDRLGDLDVELVCAGEPERLGRGGGIRYASAMRDETGDVLAMNGDELVDVDFPALLERHRSTGAAATVTVAQPPSQFGQVELTDDDVVTGSRASRTGSTAGSTSSPRRRLRASPSRATTRRPRSPSSQPTASCAPFGTRASG